MVDFNKLFYYENGKLFNKEHRSYNSPKGMQVGLTDSNGYCVLKVQGKLYKTHRVVWEMFYGTIEDNLQIDHINHNKKDNNIKNLRKVSRSENQRNQKLRSSSVSGVTGVSWHKKMRKWWVQVGVEGKPKSFGYFEDLQLAELVAREAREKYNYHPNHGAK